MQFVLAYPSGKPFKKIVKIQALLGRQTGTDRDRQGQTGTNRDREGQTGKDRDKQWQSWTNRDNQRHTGTGRDVPCLSLLVPALSLLVPTMFLLVPACHCLVPALSLALIGIIGEKPITTLFKAGCQPIHYSDYFWVIYQILFIMIRVSHVWYIMFINIV